MRRYAKSAGMAALAILTGICAGCLKVPPYKTPQAVVPQVFKEAPPEGWKQAQPGDGQLRGKWWEIFGDAQLNALEEQVAVSNENVLQLEAQFREAKAAVKVARAALFPLVTGGASGTAQQSSSRVAPTGLPTSASPYGLYDLSVNGSYTVDVWGAIHRTVRASANTAQATSAELDNAKLLYQSELAQDYFQLHGADGDAALLEDTVKSYEEYLTLTRNRFAGGVASDADVAQAETQLYTTQSELVDVQVQRNQLEHAIAILIGKPPANLSIPRNPIQIQPPQIPLALPSALLERRPDIAQAERQAEAANQQIGIAMAAFYPTLSIAASVGFEAVNHPWNWIAWPSRFWTLGPQLAQTLFDAGKRKGQLEEAQAGYDATAANYRQTVLTAFQQVEDNLSTLRVLENESGVLDDAVKSAKRSVDVSTAQYKGGTVTYLQVITVQAIYLADERTAVDLLTRRMVASVGLVQALGGGWNVSQVPTVRDVGMK